MIRVFTLLVTCAVARGATWADLPMAYAMPEAHPKSVVEDETLHPWRPGDSLPGSFQEAGLQSPVVLVGCGLYADGGSQYYIFRGSNEKFLVVCTDSAISYSREQKTTRRVENPSLFLAASHYTSEAKSTVPQGSPTEKFLIRAIKSEVERLNAEQKPGKRPNKSLEPTPTAVTPRATDPKSK